MIGFLLSLCTPALSCICQAGGAYLFENYCILNECYVYSQGASVQPCDSPDCPGKPLGAERKRGFRSLPHHRSSCEPILSACNIA